MAEKRQRRVTSTDVARASGVSRTTVSYVLNGTPGQTIPEETRRRVLEAAARLRYVPSAAARTLRSGRSDLVLLVIPDWPVTYNVGGLIDTLSSGFAVHDLTLVTHHLGQSKRSLADLWRTISPAAVIGLGEFADAEEAAMRAAGIEVVSKDLLAGVRNAGAMPEEQERIGRLQAEHLAAAGHRRLGYAFPDSDRFDAFSVPRLTGVRRVCAELGLEAPLVATVGLGAPSCARAVDDWRAAGITAVCAYNDEYAFPVLAGLRGGGLRVPEDMAVIGVDNIPLAPFAHPPLTTVELEMEGLAEHMVASVRRALAGEPPHLRPLGTGIRLILRGSA